MQQQRATRDNCCTSDTSVDELSPSSRITASVLPRRSLDDDDAASTSGAR